MGNDAFTEFMLPVVKATWPQVDLREILSTPDPVTDVVRSLIATPEGARALEAMLVAQARGECLFCGVPPDLNETDKPEAK